jgi:hypothetical protein
MVCDNLLRVVIFLMEKPRLRIDRVPVHGAHYQVAELDSPFGRVMRELGISRPDDVPRVEDPKRDYWRPTREKGKSTLTKWECGCGQKARVGTKEFFAVCTICNNPFVKVETQAQGMLGLTAE